jgi:hypothetical protein
VPYPHSLLALVLPWPVENEARERGSRRVRRQHKMGKPRVHQGSQHNTVRTLIAPIWVLRARFCSFACDNYECGGNAIWSYCMPLRLQCRYTLSLPNPSLATHPRRLKVSCDKTEHNGI